MHNVQQNNFSIILPFTKFKVLLCNSGRKLEFGNLLRNYKKKIRHIILIIALSVGFTSMFFAPEAEATPTLASIMSLSLYAIFATIAYWCDREVMKQKSYYCKCTP